MQRTRGRERLPFRAERKPFPTSARAVATARRRFKGPAASVAGPARATFHLSTSCQWAVSRERFVSRLPRSCWTA